MQYGILKNPKNTSYEQMLYLNQSCFPEKPYNEMMFEEMLKSHYWVATDGYHFVGFGRLLMVEEDTHISLIGVLNSFQRKGIGQQLLNEMIDFSRRNGAKKVTLSVKEENIAAFSLYKKNNFKAFGEKYIWEVDLTNLSHKNDSSCDSNEIVNVISLSKEGEGDTQRHTLDFLLPSGESIGSCFLNTCYPGCSNFNLKNPELYLEQTLLSLESYITHSKEHFKLMFSDQNLKQVCSNNGYELKDTFIKLEKIL